MAHTLVTRERVIVSARLIVPTSCCGGFNEKAIRFRQSINSSIETNRLEAEIAAKTITNGFGVRVKSYVDTDNKKRDFTGDTRPGVNSNELGYRWESSKTWEPGSRLVISPPFKSREGMSGEPNVGWISPQNDKPISFEQMLQHYRDKPTIKLSKYKVNPKTDEVIQESEKIIDPFGIAAGLSYEDKQKQLRKYRSDLIQQKMLPGRSLEARVPGGSLLSRAAAVFGILRDENNKFRCPPGTPAANQFTDATGSNCFGFSASKFARFAARQAAKLTNEGEYQGLRNNAKSFFNFLYNDQWSQSARQSADPAFIGRVAYWESISGDRFKPPSWRDIPVPENLRLFKNGAIRAQDDIARQKAQVLRLYDELGIDSTDPDAPALAIEALRKLHIDSEGRAGWDLQILNVSGGGAERLTDKEIEDFTRVRLESLPGWRALSIEEQSRLLESDVRRYKETERAMFETLLDQFMQNPASARFLGKIEYNFLSNDEAGTDVYRESPTFTQRILPTGEPVFDDDGNPVMRRVPGELRSVIHINMGTILANQESMLPDMRPDERLAISAIGAKSEAEGRLAVADFLVNADHTARGMAGLIDGVYSFSSHIMLHEFAHSNQAQVFIDKIQEEILENGFITVPVIKNDKVVGSRNVDSIYALNGDDIMSIMTDVADSINIKSLNDAMERIKNIAPLAGAYPRDVYTKGTEVWALEAAAELWALRERGIIYGDDIDSALEFMDNMSHVAAARERAASDDAFTERTIEDILTVPVPKVVPDDIPDDVIEETLSERDERLASSLRDEIKKFKLDFEKLSEDEMFSEAAIIGSQADTSKRIVQEIRAMTADPSFTDDERNSFEAMREDALREGQRALDFHNKKYEEATKAWRKKFGIGASGEKKRFEETVRSIREREGLLDETEMAEIARLADLDDLRERVKLMPEKKVIRRLADDEIRLSTLDPMSSDAKKLADEIDVIKNQHIENLKLSGDKRTTSQIKKEIDQNVKNTISPPPKKNKKFKTAKEASEHGARERRRVKATKEQKNAIKELGDIAQSDVGMLLDPKMQARAGRAMNRRNARLKRLGLEIDPTSSQDGDVIQQVEKLLIPSMEAIDGTSVADPFEMEAIIDFESGILRGKIDGKEVDVQQFVSGPVITGRTKKIDISERSKRDPKTGRTPRRVILQVREGDRGLFPATADGSEQKFVLPPGRIRIVGRDSDGTLRAEISYQKDSVEVFDSLANSLESNKTDAIWAKSHAKKMQASADKYVTARRASGYTSPGPRSDYDDVTAESSKAAIDEIVDSGGSFGDGFDEIPEHISESSRGLSSGAIKKQDVLGAPKTRAERTNSRNGQMSSTIREIKTILGGGDSDGGISRGDIHPEVAKLIAETPEELLIARASETAYRMHEGFDRRVRVRATDDDIERLASTGSILSTFSSSSDTADRASRRAERLASLPPNERSGRLSSGRVIDSTFNLAERRRQEKEVASRALDVFNDIINNGKNINDMSDDEISARFEGAVKRSVRKSISEKDGNLYEVDDIPTAIAMMMLGHHVEVKDQDTRLTEQAQKEFEKQIKDVAKQHIKENHPAWRQFQNEFAQKNPDADMDSDIVRKQLEKDYVEKYQADLCSLYNPAKNLMCSGHMGIDREKMPQTNGRTVGHNTEAIRALKAGRAAGKFEPKKTITPNRSIEAEFADELDKAVLKENDKRIKDGKPEVSDEEKTQMLYKLIAGKHSIGNELSGKTAAQHREESYSTLSEAAKEWLYENTDWNDTEVNLESPFIDWLNTTINVSDPENGPSVRRRTVNPAEYAPSQQQLVASKVDGMAQTMQEEAIKIAERIRAENPDISKDEFRKIYLEEMGKQWFMQPILTTKDGFILDGHHRWGGIVVANRSLPEDMQMPLNANEVQTDIIEGLTLGKVFQDAWGIKEARLGVENRWKEGEITDISDEEISAIRDNLTTNAPRLIDEKYEQGDYIQLGSVGMKNNADYAEAVSARQNLARVRRPNVVAAERERELDEAIRRADIERNRGLSSGRASVGRAARLRSVRSGVPVRDGRSSQEIENAVIPSGKSIGLSSENYTREYLSRIGIPNTVSPDLLPVSGYLVHKSHIESKRRNVINSGSGNLRPDAVFEINDSDVVGDGLTALGDIEIVLRPGVSERTAYGRGNAITSAHRPVKLNSRNREDVADAILNPDGVNAEKTRQEALMNLLSASINNDFSNVNASRGKTGKMPNSFDSKIPDGSYREPFEAQVLGGFDISDVEQVNIPFKKVTSAAENEDISDIVNPKTIAEKLRAAGFSPEEIEYFYSIGGSQTLNTESMTMLRNYRASQKIKSNLNNSGFNNIKFAHPEGFNIEDPRSHSKSAFGGESVEVVLSKAIGNEIVKTAKEMLKETKKSNKPRITSTAGGRM